MRRFILGLILLLALPVSSLAAGGGVPLLSANVDLTDKGSLQNGAKLFVNYCMGCHSANFMRFSRIGKDLEISDDLLKENLMFSSEKVGETLSIAMDEAAAETLFGVVPPDLSVVSRSRGDDWLYTYLLSFYVDESRPTGMNNLVFKDVGMPHVMWEMQGLQKAVYKTEVGHDGKEHQVIAGLELVNPEDKAKADEYRRNVRDLVNFMAYMGEPAKMQRMELGWKVLGFLLLFFFIAYLLKKEFWRDVK